MIERASIDELGRQQEELLGRPLSDEERRALVESAIDDEVLLHEAYRRGLDRDEVVQQHLVQKMRFILGEEEAERTEADLRAYLAANRDRYRRPPTVTLDQVFYADPAKVPEELMAQLENGTTIADLSDTLYMLGNPLPRYSLRDLIGLMGPDAARRISSCRPGHGTVPCGPSAACTSRGSTSAIRRRCRASPSWRAICARTGRWTSNGKLADKIAKLRQNYRIVVDQDTPSAAPHSELMAPYRCSWPVRSAQVAARAGSMPPRLAADMGVVGRRAEILRAAPA